MIIATLPELIRTESFGIFISAFLGAFFAYLFARIGTLADRLFTRRQKHQSALVTIEKQSNELQNLIGDNLFVVDDYVKTAKPAIVKKQPFIYFNELHEMPFDRTISLRLGNIDVINDLFAFEASIRKVNASLQSTNRFMSTMQQAFMDKNINLATYLINCEFLLGKMAEMGIILSDLEHENKQLLAEVRVLLKRKNNRLYTFLLRRIMNKNITDKERKQIPAELKQLNKEINDTKNKDRRRIAKLLKLIEEIDRQA